MQPNKCVINKDGSAHVINLPTVSYAKAMLERWHLANYHPGFVMKCQLELQSRKEQQPSPLWSSHSHHNLKLSTSTPNIPEQQKQQVQHKVEANTITQSISSAILKEEEPRSISDHEFENAGFLFHQAIKGISKTEFSGNDLNSRMFGLLLRKDPLSFEILLRSLCRISARRTHIKLSSIRDSR